MVALWSGSGLRSLWTTAISYLGQTARIIGFIGFTMIILVGADVSMALRAVEIVRITVAAATDTSAPLIRLLLGSDPFYPFLHEAIFLALLGKLSAAPFIAACNPVTIGAG